MADKRKIWFGLGSYLLVSASGAAAVLADGEAHPAHDQGGKHALIANAKAGHEGGEGGEGRALAGASPDEAFMTHLMLIKGHLRIGKELLDRDAREMALLHFHHPEAEIYGDIEAELAKRQIEPFIDDLQALAKAAEGTSNGKNVQQKYEAVLAKIDAAAARIDAPTRTAPTFLASVALRLLNQAGAEYEEAIADGKIVNAEEYQDARGFVWTADELLQRVADGPGAKDRQTLSEIAALMVELKKAWPSVMPPQAPAMSVSDVHAIIARIELKANAL